MTEGASSFMLWPQLVDDVVPACPWDFIAEHITGGLVGISVGHERSTLQFFRNGFCAAAVSVLFPAEIAVWQNQRLAGVGVNGFGDASQGGHTSTSNSFFK